ncbi:MAG: hypothetical protein WCH34_05410 [Bacteroidota bacterium]
MKRILFALALMLAISSSFSQTNFKWEKTDTISKTKSQIYFETKMFIDNYWKFDKPLFLINDEERGEILISGTKIKYPHPKNDENIYVYRYNVDFKISKGKFNIIIDSVHCESAIWGNFDVKKIEPFEGENCPNTGLYLSKSKAKKMMISLKQDFQLILNKYYEDIKKPIAIQLITQKTEEVEKRIIKDSIANKSVSVIPYDEKQLVIQNIQNEISVLKFDNKRQKKALNMTGDYLKKSSNNLWAYFGLTIAGGVISGVGTALSKNNNDRLGYIIAGGTIELGGIICWLIHIGRLSQAGNELKKY